MAYVKTTCTIYFIFDYLFWLLSLKTLHTFLSPYPKITTLKFKQNSELRDAPQWEELIIDHWLDYLHKTNWGKSRICTRTHHLVSIQISQCKSHDMYRFISYQKLLSRNSSK